MMLLARLNGPWIRMTFFSFPEETAARKSASLEEEIMGL